MSISYVCNQLEFDETKGTLKVHYTSIIHSHSLESSSECKFYIFPNTPTGSIRIAEYSLKNPIWLKLTKYCPPDISQIPQEGQDCNQDDNDCGDQKVWRVDLHSSSGYPDYRMTIPFLKREEDGTTEFSPMFFGVLESSTEIYLQVEKDSSTGGLPNRSGLKFAPQANFFIGLGDFIGTDDMRNGRSNQQLIEIEDKNLYLHLRPTPVEYRNQDDDYELVLGFKIPQ